MSCHTRGASLRSLSHIPNAERSGSERELCLLEQECLVSPSDTPSRRGEALGLESESDSATNQSHYLYHE